MIQICGFFTLFVFFLKHQYDFCERIFSQVFIQTQEFTFELCEDRSMSVFTRKCEMHLSGDETKNCKNDEVVS